MLSRALLAAVLTVLLPESGWSQAAGARALPAAADEPALRATYHLRLESAWPAPAGETDACNNRASETVVGTLRRVGPDRYRGRLARRTRLGFCGTHGPAVKPCGAVLHGEGEVAAEGRVLRDGSGRPTMSLVWQPIPETTETRLEGSCAPRFTGALATMYRTAVHAVDFAIPDAPVDRIVLEDYGRTLELR